VEREEHKTAAGSYSLGGVRTFPLIGLIGYSIAGSRNRPFIMGMTQAAGKLTRLPVAAAAGLVPLLWL
jgi:hypothetical protein